MKTKRVLVTGGAGFIGSHTLRALSVRGCEIALMDDFNDYYDPRIKRANAALTAAKIYEGDIRDKAWCMSAIVDFRPNAVIHLAARAGVRPSLDHPQLYMDTNLIGTLNVMDAMRDAGVPTLIFASSSSVYGNNLKVPFAEADQLDSIISPYAVSKHAGEKLCRIYAPIYGLSITALRFFTVYGPGQRPDLAISTFVRNVANELPIKVFGDGTTSRDYSYIDDIVKGILAALDLCSPGFSVYNLGGESPISLSALIQTVEAVVGKTAIIDRQPLQTGDVMRTWADITLAREHLGYSPSISIHDGIAAYYNWWRDMQKVTA